MSDKLKILRALEKSPAWWRKYDTIREYFDQIVEGSYTDNLKPLTVVDVKKLSKYITTVHKYKSVSNNKHETKNDDTQPESKKETEHTGRGVNSIDHHIGNTSQYKSSNSANNADNNNNSSGSDKQIRTETITDTNKKEDATEDTISLSTYENNKKSKKKKK